MSLHRLSTFVKNVIIKQDMKRDGEGEAVAPRPSPLQAQRQLLAKLLQVKDDPVKLSKEVCFAVLSISQFHPTSPPIIKTDADI
jgi:hypothetical protein